jgi:hypothetical protein
MFAGMLLDRDIDGFVDSWDGATLEVMSSHLVPCTGTPACEVLSKIPSVLLRSKLSMFSCDMKYVRFASVVCINDLSSGTS